MPVNLPAHYAILQDRHPVLGDSLQCKVSVLIMTGANTYPITALRYVSTEPAL
jgi:hypothetical protein